MKPPAGATPHAVHRFIERHVPDMSPPGADRALLELLRDARHVEDVPDEKQEIWALRPPDRDEILVVVREGIVRTVLPRGAARPANRRRSR